MNSHQKWSYYWPQKTIPNLSKMITEKIGLRNALKV